MVLEDDSQVIVRWNNNAPVTMISNNLGAEPLGTFSRNGTIFWSAIYASQNFFYASKVVVLQVFRVYIFHYFLHHFLLSFPTCIPYTILHFSYSFSFLCQNVDTWFQVLEAEQKIHRGTAAGHHQKIQHQHEWSGQAGPKHQPPEDPYWRQEVVPLHYHLAPRAGHALFFMLRVCAFAPFGGALRAGAFALFFGP